MSHRFSIVEDKKMKWRTEEKPTKELNLELTLRLGSNVLVYESSSNNENEENSNDKDEVKPEEFSCQLCDKKFYSVNALNGHQNAHRRERDTPEMKQEIDMIDSRFRDRVCPYPAMANHPLFHGSLIYRGDRVQPVAQMSTMPWGHFGPVFGNHGLHHRSLSWRQHVMASHSLGESVETPMLNDMNVGFGYEFNHYSSHALDAFNRVVTTHANLGGLQQNHYTRN